MLGNGAGGRVCACLCVHAHTHVHGETPTTKTSVAVRGTAEGLGCFLSPSGSKGGMCADGTPYIITREAVTARSPCPPEARH